MNQKNTKPIKKKYTFTINNKTIVEKDMTCAEVLYHFFEKDMQ